MAGSRIWFDGFGPIVWPNESFETIQPSNWIYPDSQKVVSDRKNLKRPVAGPNQLTVSARFWFDFEISNRTDTWWPLLANVLHRHRPKNDSATRARPKRVPIFDSKIDSKCANWLVICFRLLTSTRVLFQNVGRQSARTLWFNRNFKLVTFKHFFLDSKIWSSMNESLLGGKKVAIKRRVR